MSDSASDEKCIAYRYIKINESIETQPLGVWYEKGMWVWMNKQIWPIIKGYGNVADMSLM